MAHPKLQVARRQWGGGATGRVQARGHVLHTLFACSGQHITGSAALLLRQVTCLTIPMSASAVSVKYRELTQGTFPRACF